MKTQLLCTFSTKSQLDTTVEKIKNAYNIAFKKIYVFQNEDNVKELICTYNVDLNQGGTADHDYMMFIINVLADMDTSDTAYVQMHIPNAGSAQSDIVGSQKTTFSGFLAC